ncbi:hypothetical protein QBC39DRAFT_333395 [Podospora conica]|nr:hypothetical protein QBC39DRAFT_333395 [Schizothecium conicum]
MGKVAVLGTQGSVATALCCMMMTRVVGYQYQACRIKPSTAQVQRVCHPIAETVGLPQRGTPLMVAKAKAKQPREPAARAGESYGDSNDALLVEPDMDDVESRVMAQDIDQGPLPRTLGILKPTT